MPISRDPEIQANAIQLVREGKARNPNDLVLELKIPLDDAKMLFDRIVKNEEITNINTIEAVARIARYVREIEKRFSKLKELVRRGEDIEKRLSDLIREVDESIAKLNKSIEYLEILRSIPSLAEPLGKFVEEMKRRLLERVLDEKTRCRWIDEEGYCRHEKWRFPHRRGSEDMKPITMVTNECKRTVYLMNVVRDPLLAISPILRI